MGIIITLQSDAEDIKSIEQECKKAEIRNIQIKLRGANQALLASRDTIKMLIPRLKELYNVLNESEHQVLIHCAAGIHRTGIVAYTLMRMDGKSEEEAFEGLK